LLRRRCVPETFCYKRRSVTETFCNGDVLSRRRFVQRRFVCAPFEIYILSIRFHKYFLSVNTNSGKITFQYVLSQQIHRSKDYLLDFLFVNILIVRCSFLVNIFHKKFIHSFIYFYSLNGLNIFYNGIKNRKQ
jgi:hypothetical protein